MERIELEDNCHEYNVDSSQTVTSIGTSMKSNKKRSRFEQIGKILYCNKRKCVITSIIYTLIYPYEF